jgi:hypothetical protein
VKVGGEYRVFHNENYSEGTGSFNFLSVAAFLTGTANAFSITLGERTNHIVQRAVAFFGQDRITIGSTLTLDLGLRYEWHVTPTERNNQFVVCDPDSVSLLRVGVDVEEIYRQNNRNFEPRIGIAWTPSSDGRTVVPPPMDRRLMSRARRRSETRRRTRRLRHRWPPPVRFRWTVRSRERDPAASRRPQPTMDSGTRRCDRGT